MVVWPCVGVRIIFYQIRDRIRGHDIRDIVSRLPTFVARRIGNMSGRYALYGPHSRVREKMLLAECPEYAERYNIAPQNCNGEVSNPILSRRGICSPCAGDVPTRLNSSGSETLCKFQRYLRKTSNFTKIIAKLHRYLRKQTSGVTPRSHVSQGGRYPRSIAFLRVPH